MSRKILLTNSFAGALQLGITAILSLISIPIFINKLGIEQYGVFATVAIVGSINTFANLGLSQALLVFIAKQGKTKESDYDIIVTFLFLFTIVIAVVGFVLLFQKFIILHVFSVPETYYFQARQLLIYLTGANSLLLLGNTFVAIINSQQKIYLTSLAQVIYGFIYWGGLILVLNIGGNLGDVGKPILIAAFVWFILLVLFAYKSYGKVQLNGFIYQFYPHLKKQFDYGGKIYLAGMTNFTFEPLSKLLISFFFGSSLVGVYDIALRIKGQLFSLLSKILYPIYPYIASSVINETLHKKIITISKIIQVGTFYLSLILVFSLPYLIDLWLGAKSNNTIVLFTTILTLTVLLFSVPSIPIYYYLNSNGFPEKTIWIQLAQSITNVIVFFVSFKIIGVFSVVIANFFGTFSSYLLCVFYQKKHLGKTIFLNRTFNKKFLIIAVGFFIFNLYLKGSINLLWVIIIEIMILYPTIVLVIKLFSSEEISLIFGKNPGPFFNFGSELIKKLKDK